jgi:hypothetical protein
MLAAHPECVPTLRAPVDPHSLDPALDRFVFVTIYVHAGDRVWLYSGGDEPEVREVSLTVTIGGGYRVAVALVPRNVPLTLSISTSGLSVPLLWSGTSAGDVGWLPVRSALACVDLPPVADANYSLWLDGAPVTSGPVRLTTEDHQFSVLDASQRIVASVPIAAKELSPIRCFRIVLDLTPPPPEHAVALVHVESSPQCAQAGLATTTIRSSAADLLTKEYSGSRDFDGWAQTVQGLDTLNRTITALGGNALGAPRGRLDSMDTIRSSARELFRQGFKGLVSIEVHCARRSAYGWDYSVESRYLDVEALQHEDRSPTTGLSLSGTLRTEIDTVYDISKLRSALEASLGRLLQVPYVRFTGDHSSRRMFDNEEDSLEVFIPSPSSESAGSIVTSAHPAIYQAKMRVSQLKDGEAKVVCQPLTDRDALRTPGASGDFVVADGDKKWDEPAKTFEVGRLPSRVPISFAFRPDRPGTYLLEVSVSEVNPPVSKCSVGKPRPEAPLARAQTCVEYQEAAMHWWVSAGMGFGYAPYGSIRGGEQVSHTMVLGGAEFKAGNITPTDWQWGEGWAVGVEAGYMRVVHQRTAPASWQDLGGPNGAVASGLFDAGGSVPLSWVRNSFVLGPSFGVAPLNRLGIFARIIPAMDLGLFDASDVPSSLVSLNASRSVDVDFDLFGEVGVSVALTKGFAVTGTLHGGGVGIDELLIGSANSARSLAQTTAFDLAWLVGGALGVTVAP